MKCEHYDCRCAAAHALALQADLAKARGDYIGSNRMMRAALDCHDGEVECTFPDLNFGNPGELPSSS